MAQFHDFFGVGLRVEFCDLQVSISRKTLERVVVDPVTGKARPQFGEIELAKNLPVSIADEIGADLRHFVTDIEVNWPASGIPSCTLTLAPTRDIALRILETKALQPLQPFVVQFGWPERNILSPRLIFHIMGWPKINLAEEITFTLQALNSTLWSSLRNTAQDKYGDMKKSISGLGVVRFMLGEGFAYELGDLPSSYQSAFQRVKSRAEFPEPNSVETSMEYARRILTDYDIDWVQEDLKTIRFIQRTNPEGRQEVKAKYELVYYGQIETAASPPRIPLLAFNTDAPFAFLGREAVLIKAVTTDLDTGLTVEEKFDATGSARASKTSHPLTKAVLKKLGKVSLGGPEGLNFSQTYVCQNETLPPPGPAFSEEAGRKYRNPARWPSGKADVFERQVEAEGVANITATAVVPGLPDLRPFDTIKVTGIGSMFDGLYRVMRLNHKINSGGYDTELGLIRDAAWHEKKVAGRTPTPPAVGAEVQNTAVATEALGVPPGMIEKTPAIVPPEGLAGGPDFFTG